MENKFWYEQLICLPVNAETIEYKRLKRVWNDHTRFSGEKNSDARKHEFYNPAHETNMTATLWENFAIFEPDSWVNELLNTAGCNLIIPNIVKACWSYEWEKQMDKGIRICDVAIKITTASGEEHLLIIESKNLNKKISEKDTNPGYYLDLEGLHKFETRRYLIYCVDDTVANEVAHQIKPSDYLTGIITWQKLAAIQFNLVKQMQLPNNLKGFICGAILNQFLTKGITPTQLPFDYLENEPHFLQIDELKSQATIERKERIWDC